MNTKKCDKVQSILSYKSSKKSIKLRRRILNSPFFPNGRSLSETNHLSSGIASQKQNNLKTGGKFNREGGVNQKTSHKKFFFISYKNVGRASSVRNRKRLIQKAKQISQRENEPSKSKLSGVSTESQTEFNQSQKNSLFSKHTQPASSSDIKIKYPNSTKKLGKGYKIHSLTPKPKYYRGMNFSAILMQSTSEVYTHRFRNFKIRQQDSDSENCKSNTSSLSNEELSSKEFPNIMNNQHSQNSQKGELPLRSFIESLYDQIVPLSPINKKLYFKVGKSPTSDSSSKTINKRRPYALNFKPTLSTYKLLQSQNHRIITKSSPKIAV